jgi:hypothetical protein
MGPTSANLHKSGRPRAPFLDQPESQSALAIERSGDATVEDPSCLYVWYAEVSGFAALMISTAPFRETQKTEHSRARLVAFTLR